jgi:aspartyl/asparaginyl-tRNA synthetase
LVKFHQKEGFIFVNTPKLTTLGVEGGAELFSVLYFGKEAFLSQSPQIYKQMMIAAGFQKVFELGPVFRAELSHTRRHLTEFFGWDVEMADIKDENEIMDFIEKAVNSVLKNVAERHGLDLGVGKIPRMRMDEAKAILESKYGKKLPKEEDLDSEGERLIGEYAKKNLAVISCF